MNPNAQAKLTSCVRELNAALETNLVSCCAYGSVVRGNYVEGISDLNLLIVLKESTPEAHLTLSRILCKFDKVTPFILGQKGFARSVRAFASKFASIQRNYVVLHGIDLLSDIKIDSTLEKFLCEQSLRNQRLRLVFTFVTTQGDERYGKFLKGCIPALFSNLSEVLRLEGIGFPKEMPARFSVMNQQFGLNESALKKLAEFRQTAHLPGESELQELHRNTFQLLDTIIAWLENHWHQGSYV